VESKRGGAEHAEEFAEEEWMASSSSRADGDKWDDPGVGGRGFWGFTSKIAKEDLQMKLLDSVHDWL
jgi:hypothetical protein